MGGDGRRWEEMGRRWDGKVWGGRRRDGRRAHLHGGYAEANEAREEGLVEARVPVQWDEMGRDGTRSEVAFIMTGGS